MTADEFQAYCLVVVNDEMETLQWLRRNLGADVDVALVRWAMFRHDRQVESLGWSRRRSRLDGTRISEREHRPRSLRRGDGGGQV